MTMSTCLFKMKDFSEAKLSSDHNVVWSNFRFHFWGLYLGFQIH